MKILMITNDIPPFSIGGVGTYTYHLTRALQAQGDEIIVFSSIESNSEKEYNLRLQIEEGIPIVSVAHTIRNIRKSIRSLRLLFGIEDLYTDAKIEEITEKIIEEMKPDVIHIQHLVNFSCKIIDIAKKGKIPLIVTLHDYWFICVNGQMLQDPLDLHDPHQCNYRCLLYLIGKNKINTSLSLKSFFSAIPWLCFRWYIFLYKNFFTNEVKRRQHILRHCLLRADVLISPSKFLASVYEKAKIPPGHIIYLPYSFAVENIAKSKPFHQVSFPVRFAYIGRIVPEKGIHILTEAFKKIHPEKAELAIYGDAPSSFRDYLTRLKTSTKKCKNIQFKGKFSPQEKAMILQNIDVLVVPSLWWENSPLVIHEALMNKISVIAADIGGMRELISHKKNGLLFRAGDPIDLYEKMEELIENQTILEKFSFPQTIIPLEVHARKIKELYFSFLSLK